MMVSAIPEEWQWPGTESEPNPIDYRLRMIVHDMVAEHGRSKVAVLLADIAEELL